MTDLVIPIIFMLCVVLGEALWLQKRNRGSVDWHDVIFNLNSGHIMLWLFRGWRSSAMAMWRPITAWAW